MIFLYRWLLWLMRSSWLPLPALMLALPPREELERSFISSLLFFNGGGDGAERANMLVQWDVDYLLFGVLLAKLAFSTCCDGVAAWSAV